MVMHSVRGIGAMADQTAGVEALLNDPAFRQRMMSSDFLQNAWRNRIQREGLPSDAVGNGEPSSDSAAPPAPGALTAMRSSITDETCRCIFDQAVDLVSRALPPGSSPSAGDMAALNQLAVLCVTDADAAHRMGAQLGIDVESCKPWYLRKTTMIAGGFGVAAIAAYFLLR